MQLCCDSRTVVSPPRVAKRKRLPLELEKRRAPVIPAVIHSYLAPSSPLSPSVNCMWEWFENDNNSNRCIFGLFPFLCGFLLAFF